MVAGAGSVRLSAGTNTACTDVMEPFLVVVILSCMVPMSVARVGWYPTAEGIRPNRADTWGRGRYSVGPLTVGQSRVS